VSARKPDKPAEQSYTRADDLLNTGEKDFGVRGEGGKPGGGEPNSQLRGKPSGREEGAFEDGKDDFQTAHAEKKLSDKQAQLSDNRAGRAIKGNWSITSGSTSSTNGTISGNESINQGGGGQPGSGGVAGLGEGSSGRATGYSLHDLTLVPNGPGSGPTTSPATDLPGNLTLDGDLGRNNLPSGEVSYSGGTLYVSGGTFSLPVQLPEGEVQMDFARPAGGASVAVWAVSMRMVHALYGTVGLIVGLVVLLIGRKLWNRLGRSSAPRKFVVIYVIVAAVFVLAAHIAGLVLAAGIIAIIEGIRRVARRSAVRPL
jgi:hypothetical protein